MPNLLLRFPAGRYHATPWGHHVNEGLIEWPPSPWRLLRALLATGYNALHWPSDGPPPAARALILKLAGVLPHYRLPLVSGAHSRHYMPLAVLDKGREKTTLVFDTWANVGDGALVVSWDVSLEPDEHEELARLAQNLGYLGRSESWVEAELLADGVEITDGDPCFPCDNADAPGPGWEQVPVLATQNETAYSGWRSEAVRKALADLPAIDADKKKLTAADKKLLQQRQTAEVPFPIDLLACLQVTTDWLRQHGWNQPPGSRKAFYWRRRGALEPVAKVRPRTHATPAVQAMLLSMSTGSGNDHALPNVIRTLPQAELLHDALVAMSSRLSGRPSRVLTGCDEHRRPLTGPHQHMHVLPLDLDDDAHIEHILLWAPMGFDDAAQQAVRRIRRTFTKGGVGDLKLVLAASASGSPDDLCCLGGEWGLRLAESVLHAGATSWESVTPFVPPRHIKSRGRNTIEGQVRAELHARNLPEPDDVQILDLREDARRLRLRHYIRVRRRGTPPPIDRGFAIRLHFPAGVAGPLALGYGAHFGLGLFAALR